MGPASSHLPAVAQHIATHLYSSDIMFLQEIQDNSGEAQDGQVAANLTLTTLANAIKNAGGVQHNWTEVVSIDG